MVDGRSGDLAARQSNKDKYTRVGGSGPEDPISVMILPQVHLRTETFPQEIFRGVDHVRTAWTGGHHRLICGPVLGEEHGCRLTPGGVFQHTDDVARGKFRTTRLFIVAVKGLRGRARGRKPCYDFYFL